VNCAAIPRELIESELFGYEKGAFSGARADGKTGMIEAAENGTLFLDEVGDLSPEAQAKLLRFLETGEYYRLGSTRKFTIKTRVISATNKDLDEMMTAGTFRKDLFFRLGVIKVRIPSLNERKSDILPIARHFLMEFNHKFSRSFNGFSPEAEKALVSHEWTGNVRELKNCIERGSLVGADACLTPEDLGIEEEAACQSGIETLVQFHPLPPEGMDMPALQESLERYYIQQAITAADGNEAQAARLLNLKVHTLRYRRSRLKI
jgi:transcriptional regulator with PAS, ATPase and Fis domain